MKLRFLARTFQFSIPVHTDAIAKGIMELQPQQAQTYFLQFFDEETGKWKDVEGQPKNGFTSKTDGKMLDA
jgi:hypothetical protein